MHQKPLSQTMSGAPIYNAPSGKISRLARDIVQQGILYLCAPELDGIGRTKHEGLWSGLFSMSIVTRGETSILELILVVS